MTKAQKRQAALIIDMANVAEPNFDRQRAELTVPGIQDHRIADGSFSASSTYREQFKLLGQRWNRDLVEPEFETIRWVNEPDGWNAISAIEGQRLIDALSVEFGVPAEQSPMILFSMRLATRAVLTDLFDGRFVDVPADLLPGESFQLIEGTLKQKPIDSNTHMIRCFGAFVEILKHKPFPYGRCSVCLKFFLRVRRQKYCSPPCASRGLEAARRGNRLPYMRELMRKKRERERHRLAKQKER